MIFEKSCGAVVFKKEQSHFSFLIIKSKTHQFYSFPKGHIEQFETEEETALREVFEETNIEIELIDHFKEMIKYNSNPNTIKEVIYFIGLAKNNEVKIQIEEIAEYKWLTYEDALELLTYDNEKQILQSAYKFLTSNH